MKEFKKILMLLGAMAFLCIACGDEEPDPGTDPDPVDMCAYDTFDLVGEWDLELVNVVTILGTQTDSFPTGGIVFNDDGTGVSSFMFMAFNIPVDFDNDTIQYTIDTTVDPPTDVVVTQSDGTMVDWKLKNHDNCYVEAEFTYDFQVATADVEVQLVKK